MGAAKMKPRDSIPTTASIFLAPIFARSPSIAAANASPSLRRVVMSLKRIPGFGKSGTSRMRAPRSFVCTGTTRGAIEGRVQNGPDDGWTPRYTFALGRPRARARRARRMRRSDPNFRGERVLAERVSGGLPHPAKLEARPGDRAASLRAGGDAGDDRAMVVHADSCRARELLREGSCGLEAL